MKESKDEQNFYQKESAYCKGWNEIYALEEMKLKLSGAMDLVIELSSITGFEILGGSL